MNFHDNKGLALISVLFCLLIISSSLTALFDALALEKSLAYYYKSSWNIFHQAELALVQCEKRLLSLPFHKLIENNYIVEADDNEIFDFEDVVSKGEIFVVDKKSGSEAGCLIVVNKVDIESNYKNFSGGAISASVYAYADQKSDNKNLIRADYYLR